VQKAAVVETYSQQQQQQQPIKNPYQKTLHPPSGSLLHPVVNKEVEQHIVTRETCFPISFSELKQLRKSNCAAFCLLLQLGPKKSAILSLQIVEHSCAYVKFS
jgi:hypothetical protein